MANTKPQQLTITEDVLEQHMFQKIPVQAQNIIKRIYLAAMKLCFSPQTHGQMVQGFEQQMQMHPDLAANLGADMAHIMMILFQQSKGTMPQGAIIPAGTLLTAKVCEFLQKTGDAPVTDAIFGEAVHIMTVALMSKFDPKFQQRMAAGNGALAQQQTPAQPAQQPAQPAGMLGS